MPKVEREKLVVDKEELSVSEQDYVTEIRSLSDHVRSSFQRCFDHLFTDMEHETEPSKVRHADDLICFEV